MQIIKHLRKQLKPLNKDFKKLKQSLKTFSQGGRGANFAQEDDLTGRQPQERTNLQEIKLGQLVWLVKVDMSSVQLSPSLSFFIIVFANNFINIILIILKKEEQNIETCFIKV